MWYIDNGNYGKRGFTKQVVDATLRKHECGFDVRNAGNIRKGIKKILIGNKIFVPAKIFHCLRLQNIYKVLAYQ